MSELLSNNLTLDEEEAVQEELLALQQDIVCLLRTLLRPVTHSWILDWRNSGRY